MHIEARGRHPTFEERKGALLNMLPQKFKEEVFFRIPALQDSMVGATAADQDRAYFTLRAQLQRQVEMTIQWSAQHGGLPGGAQANVLPTEDLQNSNWDTTGLNITGDEEKDVEAVLAWRTKGKSEG